MKILDMPNLSSLGSLRDSHAAAHEPELAASCSRRLSTSWILPLDAERPVSAWAWKRTRNDGYAERPDTRHVPLLSHRAMGSSCRLARCGRA